MPLTKEEYEQELNKILVVLDIKSKRSDKMEGLLKQALPYVKAHYERSGIGFGKSARILMNEIEAVLHMR